MKRSTDDIARIVSFGGGVIIDGSSLSTDDLVRIVSFTQTNAALVVVRKAGSKSTDDLVRIASYGKGKVIFEL